MAKYASVYFSPSRDTTDNVIGFIDRCEASIDAAVYSLTHAEITEALVRAHNRGVQIRVVTDKVQAGSQYAKDEYLIEQGIPLLRDQVTGLMHHKYIIGDSNAVGTGSFNWTISAEERNQENFVIIRLKYMVEEFQENFNKIWKMNQ